MKNIQMLLLLFALILSACDQPNSDSKVEAVVKDKGDFYVDSSLGIPVTYDFRPASGVETQELLTKFFMGFQMLDAEALKSAITDDFVWYFKEGVDAKGYQVKGVDGVIENLTKRKEEWKNVQYSNNSISGTPETIFQSYTVDYDDADGRHHSANGIDIYKIRGGKIASKDSYWKRVID